MVKHFLAAKGIETKQPPERWLDREISVGLLRKSLLVSGAIIVIGTLSAGFLINNAIDKKMENTASQVNQELKKLTIDVEHLERKGKATLRVMNAIEAGQLKLSAPDIPTLKKMLEAKRDSIAEEMEKPVGKK